MVEEEIPPSWQVEENTVIASEDKEVEWPLLCANRLSEEHLQLIFEIRQKQDDQLHSQRILGQRLDILFDALADAPVDSMPNVWPEVHPCLQHPWPPELACGVKPPGFCSLFALVAGLCFFIAPVAD
jgi:hypothetical protein